MPGTGPGASPSAGEGRKPVNNNGWNGSFAVDRGTVYQVRGDDLWGGTLQGAGFGGDMREINRGGWKGSFAVHQGRVYQVRDDADLWSGTLRGLDFGGDMQLVAVAPDGRAAGCR